MLHPTVLSALEIVIARTRNAITDKYAGGMPTEHWDKVELDILWDAENLLARDEAEEGE